MFAKRAHLFIYSHYEYGVRLYSIAYRGARPGARARRAGALPRDADLAAASRAGARAAHDGHRGARGYPLRSPVTVTPHMLNQLDSLPWRAAARPEQPSRGAGTRPGRDAPDERALP